MATICFQCPSFSKCARNANRNLVFDSSILCRQHLHMHGGIQEMYRGVHFKRKNSVSTKQWGIMSWRSSTDHHYPEFQPSHVSPSDTIKQFYDCINSKHWKQLGDFISDDCYFEDYTFPKPFEEKEEVIQFFRQLTEGMGKNLKFVIQNMCCGDKYTIATMWHLEWNDKQIPLTRGCSFYECEKHEGRYLIKHARVLIESPIKPGALALTLLKFVTNLFDEFPKATEKFLQRPYLLLQLLKKIYNIFVEPFIHPLLACYINLWKFIAQLLSYALKILLNISRIFFK